MYRSWQWRNTEWSSRPTQHRYNQCHCPVANCVLVDSNSSHYRHSSIIHSFANHLSQEATAEEEIVSCKKLVASEFNKWWRWAGPSAEWERCAEEETAGPGQETNLSRWVSSLQLTNYMYMLNSPVGILQRNNVVLALVMRATTVLPLWVYTYFWSCTVHSLTFVLYIVHVVLTHSITVTNGHMLHCLFLLPSLTPLHIFQMMLFVVCRHFFQLLIQEQFRTLLDSHLVNQRLFAVC